MKLENISGYKNYFVCGKTGTGKTTLTKLIIEEIKKQKSHSIFIFDVNNEYSGDFIIKDLNEYELYFSDEENHFKPGKMYVFKFSNSIADYETIISDVHHELESIYLVIDEANLHTQPTYIQDDLKNFVALHRHKKSNYLVISRRPAEISRYLTAQTHQIFSFRITENRDLVWLKDYGFNPEELKTLKKPVYHNNKLVSLDYRTISDE